MLAVMETCERGGKPSHMRAFMFADVVIGVLQRNKSNRIYVCACVCFSVSVCVNKEIYY